MPLTSTNVILSYSGVAVGIDVNVPIPCFHKSHVVLKYGKNKELATVDVDFSVVLDGPEPTEPPSANTDDYQFIIVTPTASLLDKIAASEDAINVIYVGREVPLVTDFGPMDAFTREKIDVEFASTNMKLQQIDYRTALVADAEESANAAAASAALADASVDAAAASATAAASSATAAADNVTASGLNATAAANSANSASISASSSSGSASASAASAAVIPAPNSGPAGSMLVSNPGQTAFVLTPVVGGGNVIGPGAGTTVAGHGVRWASTDGLHIEDIGFAPQPLNATLTAMAAFGVNADKVLYSLGSDAWAEATITAFARTVIDDVDAPTLRTTIGLGNVDNTSDATKNSASTALTNKTIDADLNVVSNIENADIKVGAAITATKIGTGAVNNTEFSYLAGVTSGIQGQINAISGSSGGGPGTSPIAPLTPSANTISYYTGATTAAIISLTAAGRALIDDADAAAQRVTLALGNVDNTSDATKNAAAVVLTNKTIAAGANNITGLTKTDVGLSNVDNTSDTTKNAAAVTLTNKTLTTPVINAPTGLVKSDVGLGSVDNTSDATKNAAAVTLTNKRVTKRVTAVASSATPTPSADTDDNYNLTALAAAAAFAAPSGTPTAGQPLVIRIKDNGTARVLSWDAIYRAIGVVLPLTTVISKTMYVGMFYNSTDTKWDVVALAQEA